jgi:predicted dehydrogenase
MAVPQLAMVHLAFRGIIVEQHVHNLDVVNWAINGHPISAMGMGGRQLRTLGNIYDHFAVDFEYADGVRLPACAGRSTLQRPVCEYIIGTTGVAYLDGSNGRLKVQSPGRLPVRAKILMSRSTRI